MKEFVKPIDLPLGGELESILKKDSRIESNTPLFGEVVEKTEVKTYQTLDESLSEVSEEEKNIYENSNLEVNEVNGRECFTRTDINYEETDARGRTNLERMLEGKPPLIDGKPVELHHIGQKQDGPLAELTQQEHRGSGNDGILHDKTKETEIDRNEFKKEREQHWKSRAEDIIAERGEN